MFHFCNRFLLCQLALSFTFFSFAFTTTLDPLVHHKGLTDIASCVRLGNLAKKGFNLSKKIKSGVELTRKDVNKMLNILFEIKGEIGQSSNISINLNSYIDDAFKKLAKQGHHVSSKQIKEVKKIFFKDNRHRMLFSLDRKVGNGPYDPNNQTTVTLRMVFGVGLLLSGVLVAVAPVPIPEKGYVAAGLIADGLYQMAEAIMEEQNKINPDARY